MLPPRIAAYIEAHALLGPGEPVLVGVSGGLDSVVLLDVLAGLGHPVHVAHVDYGLRGGASDGDADFVRALAERYGAACHVRRCDPRGAGSLQATARAQRYAYFAEVAAAQGVAAVAVAHHRDDQAETVLLNLLRGAGLAGLAGMAPARPLEPDHAVRLIRPLLDVSRADLEAYARAHGLPWRTDASNAACDYRRNVLRNDVLPLLRATWGGDVAGRIAASADLMRAYRDDAAAERLRRLWDAAARQEDEGGRLEVEVLRAQEPVWQGRLVLEALFCFLPGAPRTRAAVEAVRALVDAQPGRRVPFGAGTVWRGRGVLRFAPARPSAPAAPVPLRLGAAATSAGACVRWVPCERPARLDAGAPEAAFVDLNALPEALLLRPWRAGDRLQPLGMAGTKRVSDLLTDARVPVERRAGVVVVEAEGRIVWVAGVRLAHPFRVTAATRRVGRLVLERDEKPASSGQDLSIRSGGP